MCRLICFSGNCTKCATGPQTWSELTQELSCLQAKNAGRFGACERGVDTESHKFDQVCDECEQEDEAIGILEVDDKMVGSAADIDFLFKPSSAGRVEKPEDDKQAKKRVASAVDDTNDDDEDDGADLIEVAQNKKQRT